jgi:Raf kinase inhibitor-like YbhB/YbcL family protein
VRPRIATGSLLACAVIAGCGGGSARTGSVESRSTLTLTSSAFLNGSNIPARYTCDGEDGAPPLTWTRVPVRARSLALLVEDKDAPGGAFLHWSVYGLSRGSSGIAGGRLPAGSREGKNSLGHVGYTGPCPPKGDPAHHYLFMLFALDVPTDLAAGASPGVVRGFVAEHSIASGTLTGLYRR